MSSVSITLEHFLRQQEGMSRPTTLPTPPCEPDMQLLQNQGVYPGTPQNLFGNMANSYGTPPITPEEGHCMNGNENKRYQQAPRVRSTSAI
jgi:hypothetical protein